MINETFTMVSRVVLDPRYRGAGIAAEFLKTAVRFAPTRYVEMVTSMGETSRFWRSAGFADYGPTDYRLGAKVWGKDGMEGFKTNSQPAKDRRTQSLTARTRYFLLDRGADWEKTRLREE